MKGPQLRELAPPLALVALCLTGASLLADHARPVVEDAPAGLSAVQQARLEQSASASLFGQFRSSLSDYLWLKVDNYVHSGVDLREKTEEEKQTGAYSATSHDGHDQGVRAHDGNETTVVPEKARDWRGPMGDIERDVQPYQDIRDHVHRDPREALPLFRLMTVANPRFVQGYVDGASVIARDPSRLNEAVEFLHEGLHNNPHSIEILSYLGAILFRKKHDADAALPYLLQAVQFADAREFATLGADEKEALQDAYRCLVVAYRDRKEEPLARRFAEEGLKREPQDPTCIRYLRDIGVLPEPK